MLLDERNEGHQRDTTVPHDELVELLADRDLAHIRTRSRSVLSKYFQNKDSTTIYVVAGTGAPVPLEEYTPLYARYQKPALLERVFVDPSQREEARKLLAELVIKHERKRMPTTPPADA